jgi:hypothetical protein
MWQRPICAIVSHETSLHSCSRRGNFQTATAGLTVAQAALNRLSGLFLQHHLPSSQVPVLSLAPH